MKIRTQLKFINVSIWMILGVVIFLNIWLYLRIDKMEHVGVLVQKISSDFFQRVQLRHEYFNKKLERIKQQWFILNKRIAEQQSQLEALAIIPSKRGGKLEQVQALNHEIHALFVQLVDYDQRTVTTPERVEGSSDELRDLMMNEMIIAAYRMHQKWFEFVSESQFYLTHQFVHIYQLAMMALGILGGIMIIFSRLLKKRISDPLLQIAEGTKIIAKGNLDYKIKIDTSNKRGDEIGELAHDFNRMAENLKLVTTSKEELDKQIAKRQKSEEELLHVYALLHGVIAGTTDAIYVKDLEGRYLLFNHAAERFTGRKAEEVLGKDDKMLFELAAAQSVMNTDRKVIMAGETSTFEEDVTTITGKKYVFHSTKGAVFNSQGEVMGIFGVARDVTEDKRAYKERLEMQSQLLHTSKLAAIGTMAAGVAHEINNPLAIIHGYAEILKEKLEKREALAGNTKEVLDLTKKILVAADRIASIVNGLNLFARADKDLMEVLDLNLVIKDILGLVESMYSKEGVAIEFTSSASLAQVEGNNGKLQQTVLGLLSNAKDAIKQVRNTGLIQIAITGDEQKIRLSIGDNGCGIPESMLSSIFDPFYTTKDPGKGTGLGLSIASTIVQSMKGSISVTSSGNVGSTFTLTFPNASDKAQTTTTTTRITTSNIVIEQDQQEVCSVSGKVLVVDDEVDVQGILQDILEQFKFAVETTSDPHDALRKLKSSNYDYVITDMKMPEMSGQELILEAKKLPHLSKTRYIIITGDILKDHAAEGIADRYLKKPFLIADIVKALGK
ncbi:MAG: response regulator [Oligoflexia bacterium]|nr:response regulator [Oligoflexia bacterium]